MRKLSFSRLTTLGIAVIVLAVGLAPLPSAEAQKKGGGLGGLVGGVLANYIYDALTGNKVPVTPPMDGKITAKPKVEAYNGRRFWAFINGYSPNGLRPDQDRDRKRSKDYNLDKWTEYFNVDYGEVVDNPDYDPDAEPGEANSRKYILPVHGEFNDHGDEYRAIGQWIRNTPPQNTATFTMTTADDTCNSPKKADGCMLAKANSSNANTV